MARYMIPCLLGLEKLVGDEVKRLGLKNVRVENGRIFCDGTDTDCARLNINLRCGARVLLVLGEFPARSFEELFQGVKAIAWEDSNLQSQKRADLQSARLPITGYNPEST